MQTVSFQNEQSGDKGLDEAGKETIIIHDSYAMLVAVYGSKCSCVHSWVPEGVKVWYIPLRVLQLIKTRTPPRLAGSLERQRKERVRRIVDWKEEGWSAYKN